MNFWLIEPSVILSTLKNLKSSSLRPNQDLLLAALKRAATKADVRALLDTYGHEPVSDAWKHLDSIDKAALSLVRVFNGTLLHDTGSEPDPVRDQQANTR